MAKAKSYMDTAKIRDMDSAELLRGMEWVIGYHLKKYCKTCNADTLRDARHVLVQVILEQQQRFDPGLAGSGNFEGWIRVYLKRAMLDFNSANECPVHLSRAANDARMKDGIRAVTIPIQELVTTDTIPELSVVDTSVVTRDEHTVNANAMAEVSKRVHRLSKADRTLYHKWRDDEARGMGSRLRHGRVHALILPRLRRGLTLA